MQCRAPAALKRAFLTTCPGGRAIGSGHFELSVLIFDIGPSEDGHANRYRDAGQIPGGQGAIMYTRQRNTPRKLADVRDSLHRAIIHPGFRRYFTNTAWLFGEQILRIVAGLLVGVYVTRYLGPDKYGVFSYAIAFVALFASVAKLGLDGIVVRDLVKNPGRQDAYLGTAFWLKAMGALLAGACVAVALAGIDNPNSTKLYISIIAGGLIFQSMEVVDFYFQSQVQARYVSICKIIQLSISSLLKLYFVATGADLVWFVAVSVVDQATLAAALLYAYLSQKNSSFLAVFDVEIAKHLLRGAGPLLVSSILVAVYVNIDRILLKEMTDVRAVGIYTAATALVLPLYLVPRLITNSVYPAMVNAKQRSEDEYNRRISMLYKYLLVFGAIASAFVSLLAPEIIGLLYGHRFDESATVLRIYVWNLLVICFSSVFGKWLLTENLQRLTPAFSLVAIVSTVTGCLVMIPHWGVNGAAMAALFGQLVPFIGFAVGNKQLRAQVNRAFRF